MFLTSCPGSNITNVVYDSRVARPGSLFVCLRGAVTDGHEYAKNAYNRGCRAFAVEELLVLPADAKQYKFPNTRIALALISAEFFGFPADKLKLIGITGTKGKTSTAAFIYSAFNNFGKKTAMIGTNGIFFGERRIPTINSTPESHELHRVFAEMVSAGIEYVVMEVSSQAYKMNRVHRLEFEQAVFTNLSPDHIGEGEHKDFDEYRDCKAELFHHADCGVFNIDDENAGYMMRGVGGCTATFSVNGKNNADFTATDIKYWRDKSTLGVSFTCNSSDGLREIVLKTPGEFSVYNALAAITVCRSAKIDWDVITRTLRDAFVKGRFEVIDTVGAAADAIFIIDYAHNELSLKSALGTLRKYNPKRLVCLIGSVGGRTALRRETLGKIAGSLADFCILTSDNPDKENPLDIIRDIERGVKSSGEKRQYTIIADRAEAVRYAVRNAEPGDIVLFAGKGHESYQIIGGEYVSFSERKIITDTASAVSV